MLTHNTHIFPYAVDVRNGTIRNNLQETLLHVALQGKRISHNIHRESREWASKQRGLKLAVWRAYAETPHTASTNGRHTHHRARMFQSVGQINIWWWNASYWFFSHACLLCLFGMTINKFFFISSNIKPLLLIFTLGTDEPVIPNEAMLLGQIIEHWNSMGERRYLSVYWLSLQCQ